MVKPPENQPMNSDNTIVWYTIEYDQNGNEISYHDTALLEYDSPILIRGFFPGTETAASAAIRIFDDAGNKIFEDTKEINNGTFEARCVLKTTKERLMELGEDDFLYFICEIDDGKQPLKSDIMKAAFTYKIFFSMWKEDLPDAQYILSSTDDIYQLTRNPVYDIEQSEQGLVLKFRNVIPNKEYTFSTLQEGVSGWDPITDKPSKYVYEWTGRFYELFSTIDY
jgi:hypothetical protein